MPLVVLKIWLAAVVDGQGGAVGEVLAADKNGIVVACGEQALQVLELQREGSRRMTVQEFLAGHPLAIGTRLGL